MNRWIARTVTFATLAAALVVPAGTAFAQTTQAEAPVAPKHGHRMHHEGLLGAALKLDSLTPAQRSAIEQLVAQKRAAEVPVRQADAQVLTQLAQQVERGPVDAQALAPSVALSQRAAIAESAVDRDALARLHAILTPEQRAQVVDGVEASFARHGEHGKEAGEHQERGERVAKLGLTPQQKAQIRDNLKAERPANATPPAKGQMKAALESFRSASFDPSALVKVERGAERSEKLAQAMAPVLTPNQRSAFAEQLRNRAAHMTQPKQ